ncbi:tRNA guanosine(34) transglycosylase Tgt [Actinomyces sp. zg-332]|uniref:tRNA guanosine(34) transglycosylase Tgt n=1 Tax=Actinomyces sp. zg-332 TaxID=2708340 RepID=UPI00142105BC|nr:tRNA guanosine(34) transglycosylase Tgt [Actinomyces sp. zg-332]QPK94562.1 tRNA guanosine(34) transglycosylase Tgt [Actinomyces sp. zg-332]
MKNTGFTLHKRLETERGLGRIGTIHTPHGDIQTPAFIPVGTKATVKAVLPETVKELGAQAVLANAYHLYLEPGSDLVDEAGGLGKFMNWGGPTYTDSGGFQVLSLGAGYKKVLTEEFSSDGVVTKQQANRAVRLARKTIDEDGVTFTNYIDGSKHRFTSEVSMRIQHELGADIIFGFDELTSLIHPYWYQVESLERTRLWAQRCLKAHKQLTQERKDKPYQQLFGVIQGAQHEDLRRKAARDLGEMEIDGQMFDGFGIGGALQKERLGEIVGWVTEELPENKARHLLGISEPDDFFAAVEAGADTFDCVSPSRVARNGAFYTPKGRLNVKRSRFRRDFSPLDENCKCYTCTHYTKAYISHLFRAKEMLASTLMTIHNEFFIVGLVDSIRNSMNDGSYMDLKEEVLGNYYS